LRRKAPQLSFGFAAITVTYSNKKMLGQIKNHNKSGGASRRHFCCGFYILSKPFITIKVNFVNFFNEDLTFEKWDNAKL
jgi:hypothetical protein